ncbi:MAG: hypothetical protein HRO68_07585 [Nitrosopumilus sp.]|nr:hypothetical protein [Nitrosopumilus sp.]
MSKETTYTDSALSDKIKEFLLVAAYLVFGSGKTVITGINSEQKLSNTVFEIRERLKISENS